MGNVYSTASSESDESEIDPAALKITDIRIIQEKTQLSQEDIYMWHQRFLNEQPDGMLKLDKFIQIYSNFYPFGDAEKYARIAFKVFDEDNSGTITFKEFMIGMSFAINKLKANDFESSLDYAFAVFDKNGDGTISKKEMLTIVETMYVEFGHSREQAQKKVKEIFEKYDLDKSNELDKYEFKQFIISDSIASRVFL